MTRYPSCRGPCQQGEEPCPTPDACMEEFPPATLRNAVIAVAVVALAAVVSFVFPLGVAL